MLVELKLILILLMPQPIVKDVGDIDEIIFAIF